MHLHRQLADMRGEHAATGAAAPAAGVERRIADAQPTEQPAQQPATAVSGIPRPAHIGCAALLATAQSTQPTSSTLAQDELLCQSHERIKADVASRSSLPAADVVHLASTQLVTAAAATQTVLAIVGCNDSDGAAGKDAFSSMLSQGPMGSQQAAHAQGVDHSVVVANDNSTASASASVSAAVANKAVYMHAAKLCLAEPLVVEDTQAARSHPLQAARAAAMPATISAAGRCLLLHGLASHPPGISQGAPSSGSRVQSKASQQCASALSPQ